MAASNARIDKPSIHFCKTGNLDEANGETYNQNLHNDGKTPKERCFIFLDKYSEDERNDILSSDKTEGGGANVEKRKNPNVEKQKNPNVEIAENRIVAVNSFINFLNI